MRNVCVGWVSEADTRNLCAARVLELSSSSSSWRGDRVPQFRRNQPADSWEPMPVPSLAEGATAHATISCYSCFHPWNRGIDRGALDFSARPHRYMHHFLFWGVHAFGTLLNGSNEYSYVVLVYY